MASTHILKRNDHQNSIVQALGEAVEKGAMFEWQYEMINDNDYNW